MKDRTLHPGSRFKLGIILICVIITACTLPQANSKTAAQPNNTEETESISNQQSNNQNTDPQEIGTETPAVLEVPQLEPGSTLRWIDSSLLVYIPPGEFIMGHEGEDNPEHVVVLSGFWIYRTEVTNQLYLNCIAQGKCSPPAVDPSIPNLEDPQIADHPVVGIRWDQAAAYCESVDGFLPSEAQWEKTARGPDGDSFPWGNTDPACDLLNYNECRGDRSPVRDYPLGVSRYDVFDMAGNVFEWVADWYQEDYYSNSPDENPIGPDVGEVRSVRGSTYRSGPDQVDSSLRFYLEPDEYRSDLGFRCVVGNAEQYAPPCDLLANSSPDGLAENPADPPGGSASCIVPQPVISSVTYCENGLRGFNFSWSPADANINYSSQGAVGCSMYDADTLACKGEYGSTVELEACRSCPPPTVELGVPGFCDPGYVLDETALLCRYAGPPVPGKVKCVPGYSLSGDDSCCVQEENTPLDFPVCPVGGTFDPITKICWFTLPSTGDEKCITESAFFKWCPAEPGDPPQSSCSTYTDEKTCLNNGCYWDPAGTGCIDR